VVTGGDVHLGDGSGSVSSSLLQRVRAQDGVAWERLVSLYGPLVYRWCRQAGLQAADAADVGQEVFRAVTRKIADFRRDRPGATFRGWLRTITRNKVVDHVRQQRRRVSGRGGSDAQQQLLQLPSEESEAEDAAEATLVYYQALELLRGEFEERTWQAFWRVAVGDQAPADVAAELGLTANAVYLAKSRVLRRLREEFADLLEEECG
jgi:RNA polymerase sigma-70 factor (ECF subfamily)